MVVFTDKYAKCAGRVLMPIAAILIGLYIYAATDREDTFFVNGSDMHDYGFYMEPRDTSESYEDHRTKNLPVYAHRIYEGSGTVIGLRKYSNGSLLAVDDERYEKLSVWIKEPVAEGTSNFDLSSADRIVVAYVSGGSAWPTRGCFGLIQSGSAIVEKAGKKINLQIEGGFAPSVRVERDPSCVTAQMHYSFSARQVAFSALSPWLGLPSDQIYDETYR